MNKYKITENITRQNVYNLLSKEGYSSYTCYYDDNKNILMVFNAHIAHNLISAIPDESLNPLDLDKQTLKTIKDILLSWTYDHLKPIPLFGDDKWTIFELTERDKFVISQMM